MASTSAHAASAVPPSVVSAAEDTLAAAESVGDHLSQLLAAAAEDPDAVAELPPLLRARAFLAVAQAATSLLAVRLRCSGIDPDEHPIRKEFERLSLWQEKLDRFEDWDKAPLHPTTTLNTQAAARFIGHSLSHLTPDQKRSMQTISRGERRGWSGQKRKPEPLPEKKSVRAAAEEFLAKAAQELIGNSDSRVKGPVRLIPDEDED
ncbi:nuclear nucleic acid-binding protein C1D [Panicum miliaceum]|uniref:Nuclear nucleic acid-binding protein C1D n=1 Tax=Panicum miliaceum TaxID=4540 RepID=A0A3L6PLN7_PANMI|nr:nuclear nucleic acid-binding protein C1D [Panicum miliaceum]